MKATRALLVFLLLACFGTNALATGSPITAGVFDTLALKADGTLWGWGYNNFGQLGDGTRTLRRSPVQIGVFSVVATGSYHTLAIKPDGSLWAWGANSSGQLGDGTQIQRISPIQIGTGFSAVGPGYDHSAAVRADGGLWTWGYNANGQLGDGTTTIRISPAQIGTGFVSVASGTFYSVGLKADGSLWAWGYNFNGQLGDGTRINRLTPVQVGTGFVSVAAGDAHIVGIKTDGSLWGWGDNSYGQIGVGLTTTSYISPVLIGTGYTAVAAGNRHTIAVKADGTLWAWGRNQGAQLGDGTTTQRTTPVQIGTGFRAVAAGEDHSAAIKADGSLWTWGNNSDGQLGDGTSTQRRTPVQIGTGFLVAGGGVAQSATVESVSGTVVLRTPLSAQALVTGAGFAAGSLIQTGGNGTATLNFQGGTRLVVDPDTQVTLLPAIDPATPAIILNQIRGSLRHRHDASVVASTGYSVQTPTATVHPTGTEFSTVYTETPPSGSLAVAVQSGIVEVTNRSGQTTTLVAGAQASFADTVPRVSPILPVTRGFLVPGRTNTFSWTSFPGAAGYLLEYTVNAAGFALANAASPESLVTTFRFGTGAFTDTAGTAEIGLPIPATGIPPGLRIHWRVFPTDAAGATLPGTTASDASSVTVLGSRVSLVSPADGVGLPAPTLATFSWTSYTGAAGYLFEFTLNPAGFAQVNPPSVEIPAQAIRLVPASYVQVANTVRLTVPIPGGAIPPGTRVQWRVFPVDASGQILPSATASDARSVVIQ